MSFKTAVHKKAIEIGKLSVEMTTAAGSGHPSTALSLTHLITVLMYHQMRWDPKDPWNRGNDRLVLSEGHAVPIIYAALADTGASITPIGKMHDRSAARPMTRDDVMRLREIDSPIDGHPHPQVGVPFFDAAKFRGRRELERDAREMLGGFLLTYLPLTAARVMDDQCACADRLQHDEVVEVPVEHCGQVELVQVLQLDFDRP